MQINTDAKSCCASFVSGYLRRYAREIMRKLKVVCTVLLGLLHVAKSDAAVLYDSAEGLSSFSPKFGWSIRDYPTWISSTQFAAMPFTLSQQSYVTGADLALTALAYWSGNYSVQILGDEGDIPSNTPLWTASSLESAPVYQPIQQTYSFTSVSGNAALLEANTKYWLYVACAAKCDLSWWDNTSNPKPGAIQYNSVYPYNLRWTISESNAAMFRVTGNVSAVPETASALLFASGLVALVIRGARRKPA